MCISPISFHAQSRVLKSLFSLIFLFISCLLIIIHFFCFEFLGSLKGTIYQPHALHAMFCDSCQMHTLPMHFSKMTRKQTSEYISKLLSPVLTITYHDIILKVCFFFLCLFLGLWLPLSVLENLPCFQFY